MADSGYSPSGDGQQIERAGESVFGVLSGRFVALIILLVVLTNTFLMIILPNMMRDGALRAVARSNAQVADQVKAMRNFYATAVVARISSKGILHPTWDWRNDELGVPLPATFVQEISALLKNAETQIKLVSPYPWPHRAERQLDQFQSEAWTLFQSDPGATLVREERHEGGRVLRVAVSDRMIVPSCVSCHNADPLSPRQDWKLGDVRGVMEVVKDVEPDLASAEALATRILIVICGVSTLVVVVLLLFAVQANDRARERDALFAQIQAMAYTDGLSGLLNRGRFLECARVLANANMQTGVFVLLLDLDRFKDINDEWGHAAGDGVIIEAARRLHRAISPSDLVGRLGGDEFIVCGPLDGDRHRAESLAASVVEAMRRPMRVRGRDLSLSASVGCAVSGQEADTLDTLALNADLALYRAKELGRDRHVMFTSDLHQDHLEHRRIEKLLRLAIEQDSFGFAYQPIVDAKTRAVTAFEVLLRLSDGAGSHISPGVFIPLAEELRLIGVIGEMVMRKAFAVAAQWPEPITLNVNLSPRQFNARENGTYLPDQVVALLKEAGLAPHRVTLEITETALLADTEAVFLQLEALRGFGVKLALDDFGSGYSSLSYLWKFPFDELKIDQSFSRGVKTHPVRLAEITASVVTLARSLNLDIVVEGIESECEAAFFTEAGCDHLQGYLISRPMPPDDVTPYLMRTMTALAPVAADDTDAGGSPHELASDLADGSHGG